MLKKTVVDLFAGTGAFSIAFESTNKFRTIYANDYDKNSEKIFTHNFPHKKFINQDLNTIDVTDIPKMDVLTGGFPCQPFSISGEQKGFDDIRSNVFWKLIEIIKYHRPRFVVLENVKNLVSHDSGKTFKIIQQAIKDINYHIKYQILNTCVVTNIPQNRERIYIVCFRNEDDCTKFTFPVVKDNKPDPINSILDDIDTIDNKYYYNERFKPWPQIKKDITKDISTNTIYQWRKNYIRENKSGVCPTLTANMGSGGHNVPLIMESNNKKRIRKLTPRECFSLQGMPATYKFPDKMSDACLYKLAGNAVTMPVVKIIANELANII